MKTQVLASFGLQAVAAVTGVDGLQRGAVGGIQHALALITWPVVDESEVCFQQHGTAPGPLRHHALEAEPPGGPGPAPALRKRHRRVLGRERVGNRHGFTITGHLPRGHRERGELAEGLRSDPLSLQTVDAGEDAGFVEMHDAPSQRR